MKFKSQIATTCKQSEKLLALGLKPETADMCYNGYFESLPLEINRNNAIQDKKYIPAWSLGRLIEMMPDKIKFHEFTEEFIIREKIPLYIAFDDNKKLIYYSHHLGIPTGNIFDDLVKTITGLISHGDFNKEYLNNNIK